MMRCVLENVCIAVPFWSYILWAYYFSMTGMYKASSTAWDEFGLLVLGRMYDLHDFVDFIL